MAVLFDLDAHYSGEWRGDGGEIMTICCAAAGLRYCAARCAAPLRRSSPRRGRQKIGGRLGADPISMFFLCRSVAIARAP